MKISIQQPEFFPWLGYFDKIRQVDAVVFLDNVQFKKRYFENRNRIRMPNNEEGWIRIPVQTKGKYTQNINEVLIDETQPWQRKLMESLRMHYAKSPYWDFIGPDIMDVIQNDWVKLADFNIAIIQLFMKKLGLEKPTILGSTLGTTTHGSDLILEICQKVHANFYLSGRDGRSYMDLKPFQDAGVEVDFQDFKHPIYPQMHPGFEPAMSTFDLSCNCGEQCLSIIANAQNSENL